VSSEVWCFSKSIASTWNPQPTIAASREVHPGEVLALYIYFPDLEQRKLVTVRVEDR
jgi:hypothetical protein